MEAESNKKQEHFEQSDKRTDKLRSHLKGGVTEPNQYVSYLYVAAKRCKALINAQQTI